ncbi:MAG: adventurous gliding motility protein CglE [Archangium sp.]|nr:adventurous gliding motility protein CglE [Archangium sp.]
MRKLVALLICSLAPGALAATPSEGMPLKVRRGFFTETDIGGFLTLGGDNGYSNLQTYLQLGVGYQLTIGDGKGLVPLGFHVAIGANAANCFAGLVGNDQRCAESDNFTLTFLSLTGGYLHQVVERLYIGGKGIVGWTLLDPPPVYSPPTGTNRTPVSGGLNIGAAASLEYATNMDHFSVGFDVAFRIVIGPNIMSLGFYPRVQYTF